MTDTTQSTPVVLKWVDEVPPTVQGRFSFVGKWNDLIDELKAHPDQWALIGDGKSGFPATSSEHLKSKGVSVKTRTAQPRELGPKGRPLVAVYAGYFPNGV